jgi:predicted nucleotidyltransferase
MKREILSITSICPDIQAVYGFGSFFRAEPYNDIDVLIVLRCNRIHILSAFKRIKAGFDKLGETQNVDFDLLVLTEAEFAEKPLRDMGSLIPIYFAPQ